MKTVSPQKTTSRWMGYPSPDERPSKNAHLEIGARSLASRRTDGLDITLHVQNSIDGRLSLSLQVPADLDDWNEFSPKYRD